MVPSFNSLLVILLYNSLDADLGPGRGGFGQDVLHADRFEDFVDEIARTARVDVLESARIASGDEENTDRIS